MGDIGRHDCVQCSSQRLWTSQIFGSNSAEHRRYGGRSAGDSASRVPSPLLGARMHGIRHGSMVGQEKVLLEFLGGEMQTCCNSVCVFGFIGVGASISYSDWLKYIEMIYSLIMSDIHWHVTCDSGFLMFAWSQFCLQQPSFKVREEDRSEQQQAFTPPLFLGWEPCLEDVGPWSVVSWVFEHCRNHVWHICGLFALTCDNSVRQFWIL